MSQPDAHGEWLAQAPDQTMLSEIEEQGSEWAEVEEAAAAAARQSLSLTHCLRLA